MPWWIGSWISSCRTSKQQELECGKWQKPERQKHSPQHELRVPTRKVQEYEENPHQHVNSALSLHNFLSYRKEFRHKMWALQRFHPLESYHHVSSCGDKHYVGI